MLLTFFYYQLCTVGLLVTSIYKKIAGVPKTLLKVEQLSEVKIVYILLKTVVGSTSK